MLPPEYLDFFNRGRELEYDCDGVEVGQVELFAPDEVREKEFLVNSQHSVSKWDVEDPHSDDSGDYVVHALDLVKSCEHYGPEGILIYIASLNVYGQYDCDHHCICWFPKKTWWNIVAEPKRYLNAQWRPTQDSFNPILIPVGDFEFRFDES